MKIAEASMTILPLKLSSYFLLVEKWVEKKISSYNVSAFLNLG